MAVHLYFSNQLMLLAQRLQNNLIEGSLHTHVLEAPVVIVPNMNLSKWIKLTLSRHSDVFMNVAFSYLENGLWEMIGALTAQKAADIAMLDRDGCKVLLFFILMALDDKEQAVEPILRYLRSNNGHPRADVENRCWQLAGELSRLFQEYEYHRSDMIQRWCDGHASSDAMEFCQQWLYNQVRTLAKRIGPVIGRNLVTMTEYARRLFPTPSSPHATSPDQRLAHIHFFGLSQISPFHIELLSRLKAGYEIHIYSLNPSREYWEDIQTPAEKKWIDRKNVSRLKFSQKEWAEGDLFAPVDHELLSAWGKPGRENIRLLCQLTDYDFHAGFSPNLREATVLGAIHGRLLDLGAPADTGQERLPQDRSLQILACPGLRREVETVYNSILYNLETDADLCMTDIAVMVSDMSLYKPVVDSVFSQQPVRIAYNLVDASASMESVFAQGLLSFMNLARGTFSRKEVFEFLRNPCVLQRWRITPETLSIWIEWADALGIFHGYVNPHDDGQAIPEAGLFSWRQGLERLRLSRIMTPPAQAADHWQSHFNNMVPYADVTTGDQRLLEKFCTIISALHWAVARFNSGTKSATDWRDTFFQVIDQFMEIDPGMRGEKTVFQSIRRAFDHFVLYDAIKETSSGPLLTSEALWAFVRSHLEGITGGQGDYLTGGVTVSGLMPMRPIPFKIVYVMGMEEGRFPGRTKDSLLDLRIRKRRIGDVNQAERNRYLFLEILISVQKKLYLSYVSRDLQKDRDLVPCSVVHQLQRHVEQQILGGKPFQHQHIPIKADSTRYLATDAVTSWSDVMVNYNAMNRISAYRRCGLWDDVGATLSSAGQKVIARYEPDFLFPAAVAPVDTTSTVSLSIGLLRRFLLDPVAVAGQYHLDADENLDQTAETADLEDEPLASRFPVDFEIRSLPVKRWLVDSLTDVQGEPTIDTLTNEFNIVYADLTRKSRVPAGAFADHDRSRLQDDVIASGTTLLPYILEMRSAKKLFSAVLLGSDMVDTIDGGGGTLILNPVDLSPADCENKGSPRKVQISGGLPWIWQSRDHAWHCLVVSGSGKKPSQPDKYVLAPVLILMAVAASGQPYPWSDAQRMTVHVAYREHLQHHPYRLKPDACRIYLEMLVEDFFTLSPMAWLPFETVFGQRSLLRYIKQDDVSDVDAQAFAQSMQEAMQETLDPVTQLYGATVPPNILDLARRRLRAFLPTL